MNTIVSLACLRLRFRLLGPTSHHFPIFLFHFLKEAELGIRAQMRRILLSSKRKGNTHAGPCSSLRWVSDNTRILPALNLAIRIYRPTSKFPATWSCSEPLSPSDPLSEWKEHFSAEHQRPYYHHVPSNRVSFSIPDGFKTRFPRLYRRQGFHVTEDSTVVTKSQESTPVNPSTLSNLTLKQKLATYGAAGVIWYLIVHQLSLVVVFSCIYFLNIDLLSCAKKYGFHVPERVERRKGERPSFWKSFLLSIVLNKLLAPLHLVITLATAPRVIRLFQPTAMRWKEKLRIFH